MNLHNFLNNHMSHLIEIILILVSVFVSFKIIDISNNKIKSDIIKNNTDTKFLKFAPILSKLIKLTILALAVAIIMQKHGYSITSLIAGFGITGLAVGFAAKETIANLLGSFAILYDNIYNVGDYVITEGIEGTVEDINLRSTSIRAQNGILTTIPNNIIANTIVQNVTKSTYRQISETFGIVYETPSEKIVRALEILENIAKNHENLEETFTVCLDKLDNSSINLKFIAYTKTPDLPNLRKVKEDILKEVLIQFRAEQIEFAFPTQTLHVEKNEN